MIRRAARLAGWVAGLAGTMTILVWLERLEWLRVDWSDPLGWAAQAELEVVLAAGGRLVALAICAWLAVSTLAYTAARLLGADRHQVDWLAIGPIRRAIEAVLAASMMVNTAAPAMAAVDPAPVVSIETSEAMTSVDPAYIPIPAGPAPAETDAEEPQEPTPDLPVEPAAPMGASEVVVERGDHLWKLAAERVRQSLGRAPTESDIAPYWVRVVEANRNRIRSGDPDLIFPGEVIVLPAVEG